MEYTFWSVKTIVSGLVCLGSYAMGIPNGIKTSLSQQPCYFIFYFYFILFLFYFCVEKNHLFRMISHFWRIETWNGNKKKILFFLWRMKTIIFSENQESPGDIFFVEKRPVLISGFLLFSLPRFSVSEQYS